jgi:hypothetical protein
VAVRGDWEVKVAWLRGGNGWMLLDSLTLLVIGWIERRLNCMSAILFLPVPPHTPHSASGRDVLPAGEENFMGWANVQKLKEIKANQRNQSYLDEGRSYLGQFYI